MMRFKTWGLVLTVVIVMTGCGAKQTPAPSVPQAPAAVQSIAAGAMVHWN